MSFNLDPRSYMLSRSISMMDENDFEVGDQSLPMFPQPFLGDISDFDLDASLSLDKPATDSYFPAVELAQSLSYHEMAQFQAAKHTPILLPMESPELRAPPSNLSTASGPSTSSSRIGSPYSSHGQSVPSYEWTMHGLGLAPGIVNYDAFGAQDYTTFSHIENDYGFVDVNKPGFVDPSLINGYSNPIIAAPLEISQYQQHMSYPPLASPALSQHSSHSVRHIKKGSQSPYFQSYPYPPSNRRPSIVSRHSFESQEGSASGEEPRVKGRCADCAKVFKDLKAHMLTHQNERPEKCPIATCDYHTKGFARKYDKNRHTLTHYKGTMVCGFCPGSGSAAEKSFNRADVFKRHLTSVHAVEQTAPNSRKKISGSSASKKTLAGYGPDATGKCSTCSAVFNNAQDFYEHLDDCVLRIVQQEEPSEAINMQRLAEVEHDTLVHDTLLKNNLPVATTQVVFCEEDEDEFDDDTEPAENDYNAQGKAAGNGKAAASRTSDNGAVCKIQGGSMTHSKGGVALHAKGGRKKRKDFPSSWGCAQSQMKMKKRVMVAFDGTRRLWKDDMMLSTEFELRLPLADGKSYVTDLDVQTVKRANAFHDATEEERGPDLELQQIDLEELMNIKKEDA